MVVSPVLTTPGCAVTLYLLALHVELDDFAVVPIVGTLELAQLCRGARPVAADPDMAPAYRQAARVVRLADEVLEHFAGLPIEQVDALGNLIAKPQPFGRRFERVRVS